MSFQILPQKLQMRTAILIKGFVLISISFNKVIKCLQSVRNIAENPPCALWSRKLFFSSVLCSSLLRHFDTAHKGYRCLLYSSSSNMIFQIYWVYYVAFLRRKKIDSIDKLLTPCKYLGIQHKGTKKRCQDDSISQFILLKLTELYRSIFLRCNLS